MRQPVLLALCLGGTVALSGCNPGPSDAEVKRAVKSVNVIDESNLNDIMLTVADPNEAVTYFAGAAEQEPDRIDFKRGLAESLVRAKQARPRRPRSGPWSWPAPRARTTTASSYADALVRANEWDTGRGRC